MKALITNKRSGKFFVVDHVMKLSYKITDNVLWITDHRNFVYDFDLNEYDVEIKGGGVDGEINKTI